MLTVTMMKPEVVMMRVMTLIHMTEMILITSLTV